MGYRCPSRISHCTVSPGSRPAQRAMVFGRKLRLTTADSMYIELHSRSAFSFLEGASLPEDLIATCANLNMPAMALLDRNGFYGAPRFHMAAKKAGVKAHIGAEVSWEEFPISNCQFPITSGPRLNIGNWK